MTDPSFARQLITFTYPHVGNYGVSDGGDGVRPHPRPRGDHARGGQRDGRARRRAGLARLARATTASRASRASTPARSSATSATRARCAAGSSRRRCREGEARERIAAEPTMVGPRPRARGDDPRAARLRGRRRAARGSSRSTPASSARSSATSPRAGRRSSCYPCTTPRRGAARRATPTASSSSPAPAIPAALDYIVDTIRELIGRKPVFGICLGHQLLSRAVGLETFKLPFGHRGANHPVKDLRTGRIAITSQNHGFAVARRARRTRLRVRLRRGRADAREPLRRHGRGHPPARRARRLRPVPPRGRARARTTRLGLFDEFLAEIDAHA